MRIDIWSDVICPWCYLGVKRFEASLERLDWSDEVEVRFRAYQLDPTATAEPADLKASLERKYGPGAFAQMTERLTALGPEMGIDYRFDLALRVSTFDAHRLMDWAYGSGGAGAQRALGERLFEAYFTEGLNIADREVLVRLVGEAGLDTEAASSVLDSDEHADAVRADIDAARERGITGVPAFVVNDQALIPGAQDVETFVAALNRLRERAAS